MTMRTLRFYSYGEPAEVLRLEAAPLPSVSAHRIRVAVHACGLNPADWALCRGLYMGQLPRGVGLDVSGVVDAIGEGVTDVASGDRVVGFADFMGATSAGAAGDAHVPVRQGIPDVPGDACPELRADGAGNSASNNITSPVAGTPAGLALVNAQVNSGAVSAHVTGASLGIATGAGGANAMTVSGNTLAATAFGNFAVNTLRVGN